MGPGEAGPVTAWLARWPATLTVLASGALALVVLYVVRVAG